ncbi:MAG: hypothetical protein C4308_06290 [Chitinophagaceae bacterium]
MKKASLVFLFAISACVVNAQGFRRTVEERVQSVHQKLDSAFHLDKTKLVQTDSVFILFFKQQDSVRDEMMNSGGQMNFMAMRKKMQPLVDERDKKLKLVFTEEQFAIWKEQIEPSLRPRRPMNNQ